MLLRMMFLIALMAVLSETIVYGAAGLARAQLHERALQVAHTEFASAAHQAQSTVATWVQSGEASPGPPTPATIQSCGASDATGCTMKVTTAFSAPSANATSAPSCATGTNCTIYEQGNDAVAEGRAAMTVSTTVSSTTGEVLATRTATIAFRTFDVAPWATPVGSIDDTLDALADNGTGDNGGSSFSTPAPNGTSTSTLINVEYERVQGAGATPQPGETALSGNVWTRSNQNAGTQTPNWDH